MEFCISSEDDVMNNKYILASDRPRRMNMNIARLGVTWMYAHETPT